MSRRLLHKAALSGSDAPPKPLDKRWFVYVDQQTYGPFTEYEIRQLAAKGQLVDSDLVFPERGSQWIEAKDDNKLRRLFERQSPALKHGQKFAPAIRITLALAGLLITAIVWIGWPYYAAYRLAVAFRDRDVAALESSVSWDDVRQGLRSDLNAAFLRKINADDKNKEESASAIGTGLALVIGPTIINQLMDNYVTPQAIAGNGNPKSTNSTVDSANVQNNFVNAVDAARKASWHRVEYMFFSGSPFKFKVELRPERDPPFKEPFTFIFNWSGDWRLTRILLPPSELGAPDLNLSETPSKPPLRDAIEDASKKSSLENAESDSPIAIALVSKGFKAHNYQSSDYEDDITFVLQIKNTSAKDVRAFDGIVTFNDLLDNKIFSTKLAINDTISAGSTLSWTGSIKYNQFEDQHQRLRNAEAANLKISFRVRKVLFSDGNTKVYGRSAEER